MALTHENFNVDNVVFQEVKKNNDFQFQRIGIFYRYNDGTVDKLSIKTPELFSWGVQENKNKEKGTVDSFTFSLVMFNQQNGATEEEAKTIQMFEQILKATKCHMLKDSTKEEMGKWELDPIVQVMDIFWRKKDKGRPVEGAPPTMYPKLLTKFDKSRPAGQAPEISTGFYNVEDQPMDPIADGLVGSRCKAFADVIVDNIYIGGGRVSIQLKLNDVIIVEQFKKARKLHAPTMVAKSTPRRSMFDDDDDDDEPSEEAPAQATIMVRRKKPAV